MELITSANRRGHKTGRTWVHSFSKKAKPSVPKDALRNFEEVVWHWNWEDLSKNDISVMHAAASLFIC